eukprot:1777587-Alexandrium_andersonii.AAC.1
MVRAFAFLACLRATGKPPRMPNTDVERRSCPFAARPAGLGQPCAFRHFGEGKCYMRVGEARVPGPAQQSAGEGRVTISS